MFFLLLSFSVYANSSFHKRQEQDVSIAARNLMTQSKSDTFQSILKRQEESDDSQDDESDSSNDNPTASDDGESSSTPTPDQKDKDHHQREHSTTASSTSASAPVPATSIGTTVAQSPQTEIPHSDGPVNVEDVLDTLPECYKTCATTVATSYKIGCSKLTQLGCICPQPRFFNLVSKSDLSCHLFKRKELTLQISPFPFSFFST